MPRYIDADALKKDLEENYVFVGFADLLNDIIDAIDAQPTTDVVERKKGKWIDYPIADGCLQCSVCGILRFGESNYCPNCGAEMEQ